MGGQTGVGESLFGCVDAKHVGARDRLVELAVAHEVTVGEQDLRRDLHRPFRGVELGEGTDRGLAGVQFFPDFGDGAARAADDAAAGKDDGVVGNTHACTSSGFLKTNELFDPPKPSELDRAARIFILTG